MPLSLIPLLALVWLFFLFRARSLARAIDRLEVGVLKPLSIAYFILAGFWCFERAWLPAAAAGLVGVLHGIVGASLHPKLSARELAGGTLHTMRHGPAESLGTAELHECASVIMKTAPLLACLMSVMFYRAGFKLYFAIPFGALGAWALVVLLSVAALLVAYRRVPVSPSNPGPEDAV
jgi:hypothetical protein